MNKKEKIKSHRRNFLSEGIKAGGAFLAGLKKLDDTDSEKVRILTADGKVVEVDKKFISGKKNQRTKNTEILDWMKNPSKK